MYLFNSNECNDNLLWNGLGISIFYYEKPGSADMLSGRNRSANNNPRLRIAPRRPVAIRMHDISGIDTILLRWQSAFHKYRNLKSKKKITNCVCE